MHGYERRLKKPKIDVFEFADFPIGFCSSYYRVELILNFAKRSGNI
jgi:hypothetical protein